MIKRIIHSVFLFLLIPYGSYTAFGDELVDAKVFVRDKKILISAMNGQSPKQLMNVEIRRFGGVSKDGKIVYTTPSLDSKGKDDIWLYQIGKEPQKIMPIETTLAAAIVPDGLSLVLSVYRKGAIIVDLASKKQAPLPFSPFDDKYRQASLKGISKFKGDWNWHWDSNFTWSEDGRIMTFRRCSGDLDKPACLTFMVDRQSSQRPVVAAEDLAENSQGIQNHVPVGFVGNKLFVWTQADLYSYDIRTRRSTFLATDAWETKISPDKKLIAFISGANTKDGANLWLINLTTGVKSRITNFKHVDIHGAALRWSLDSKKIYFEWLAADLKNEYAWSINNDGSNLRKNKEVSAEEYKVTVPAAFLR